MSSSQRLTAKVEGRVQGVGYRVYMQEMAERMGVRGTIKNLPDGSVEVVAEGRPSRLDRLEQALHIGSPASSVTQVTVSREPSKHAFKTFDAVW